MKLHIAMSLVTLLFILVYLQLGESTKCVDTIASGDKCPSRHQLCHHEYFRMNCRKTCFKCGYRHDVRTFLSASQPSSAISGPANVIASREQEPFAKFSLVTPALNRRTDCVSFMSVDFVDFYLQQLHNVLFIQPYLTDKKFQEQTSFKIIKDKYMQGYVAIEACEEPGLFIRMQYGLAIMQKEDLEDRHYKQDASFLMAKLTPGSTFSIKKFPEYFWHVDGNQLSIKKGDPSKFHRIEPGLSGEYGTTSFICGTQYLRRRGKLMFVEEAGMNPSESFIKDATFIIRDSEFFNGFFSYEAIDSEQVFIHQTESQLESDKADDSVSFEETASFKVEEDD